MERWTVLTLSVCLTIGSAGVLLANFLDRPLDTRAGRTLTDTYLQDDFWSFEGVRARVQTMYPVSAASLVGRVLDRDPSSSFRWTDLAEVYVRAGEIPRADYCYKRAEQLAPHDPQILYAIGDFYAQRGDSVAAISRFSSILAMMQAKLDEPIIYNVFASYERLGVRKAGLLDEAIPDNVNGRAYLRYLMREADPPAARNVWRWISKKNFDDDQLTVDYANYLLNRKLFADGGEAWLHHFGQARRYSEASPVFNGGFEYVSTAGIPDWNFDERPGIKAVRDHASRFEGEYSMRLDFTGNDNPDFRGLNEVVFVSPGTYQFEGHIRTNSVTSDEGVRFRLSSLPDGRQLAETNALIGTNDWKRLQTTVDIPQGTRAIRLELARRRSVRIDNQLSGTAWVDAVSLTRVQ